MELPQAISAILFYQAEPISVKRLAGYLKRSEGDIRDALKVLEGNLGSTGICLVQNGDEVTLGTRSEASELIAAITKEELSRELSKASVETLSIVLYKGPVTRSEIDYIRGVNSTFILRNLLIRGLVEKVDNPKDQRSFLYRPSFQLLEHMGVAKIEDLPDYAQTISALAQFVAQKEAEAIQATAPAQDGDGEEKEADLADELDAGENFDDNELKEHADHDRPIGI